MDPEDFLRGVEVDEGRVLERGLVALEIALKVDRQDDAHGQHGDQEQVADDVALESAIKKNR